MDTDSLELAYSSPIADSPYRFTYSLPIYFYFIRTRLILSKHTDFLEISQGKRS